MSPTDDDVRPLGAGGKIDYRAAARVAAKWAAVIGAAVGAGIGAYRSATSESKDLGQAVKNKSEAGYQVLLHEVADLRARLAAVEAIQRRPVELPAARRGPKSVPRRPALVPVVAPKKLPPDLDKAERQIYPRAVSPAAAPSPDAAP